MRRFLKVGLGILPILALLALLTTGVGLASAASPKASPASAKTLHPYVTFYGWLDNSPPGGDIAYPCIHSQAGGTGTYSNPITFATDKSEIKACTKIYVPFLKKYFIMEDDCAQCDQDWSSGHKYHVDLWTGGNNSSGQALINCEDALTRSSATIQVNPASNLSVDTTPLFNTKTHKCYSPGS